MAVQTTTNLGLTLPYQSDAVAVSTQNDNMETIDAMAGGVESGLAIVSDGNTHAAITAGQFVYVRHHSTLAEGLYKASSDIAANATLSSSNLTACSSGGMNDLKADITTLNSQMANITTVINTSSEAAFSHTNIPESSIYAMKVGRVVTLTFEGVKIDSSIGNWTTIGAVGSQNKPKSAVYVTLFDTSGIVGLLYIGDGSGGINTVGTLRTSTSAKGSITYITSA